MNPMEKSKRKTWRCFHCDEVFRSRKAARLHFGSDDYGVKDPAACVDPLRKDEKARMDELREAQRYALSCRSLAVQADEQADELSRTLDEFQRITGCKNTNELRMWMDSQKGRVVTANALIDAVRAKAPDVYAEVIQ